MADPLPDQDMMARQIAEQILQEQEKGNLVAIVGGDVTIKIYNKDGKYIKETRWAAMD